MGQDDGIDQLARVHASDAIEILADEMRNAFESRDRIRAAEAVLDRGYGKPSQAIIAVPANRRQQALLASMGDDALVAIIEQKKLPRIGAPQKMITIQASAGSRPASSHGPLESEDTLDPLLL